MGRRRPRARMLRRSRRRFKSARAAWADIRKRGIRGPDYRGIAPMHTRTHWVFRVI